MSISRRVRVVSRFLSLHIAFDEAGLDVGRLVGLAPVVPELFVVVVSGEPEPPELETRLDKGGPGKVYVAVVSYTSGS
jgi:hypothetical protein